MTGYWQERDFREVCFFELYTLFQEARPLPPKIVSIARAFSLGPRCVLEGTVRRALKKRGIEPPRARTKAICWERVPLGEVSDVALGKQLSVSAETVRLQRVKRNIPAYRAPGPRWDLLPLGQVKDEELAKRLGCALTAVQRARRALQIPPLGGRGGRRTRSPVVIDLELKETWAKLYLEGVSVPKIKKRYSDRSLELISRGIREVLGVDRLGRHVLRVHRRAA